MITSLEIQSSGPLVGGKTFGKTGAYVRMVGIVRGEVDPAAPGNRGIADIDKAPRNARGRVEYEADIVILRPADASLGNGRILYEVNNRGHKRLLRRLAGAPKDDNFLIEPPSVGSGFPMQRGFTVVWSGWDATVPRNDARMSMNVPVATDNGKPIVAPMRDELVSGARNKVSDTFRLSYEAASLDTSKARLTVRRYQNDPRVEIPANEWEFVDARTIRLLPAGRQPQLGWLYEINYQATKPLVLGLGYAATRDVVSYLRNDPAAEKLLGRKMSHALAIGFSQSGRFLRDFTWQGFNKDEAGCKVFDGMLAHTAGIGRVSFNHRFGQPNRTGSCHQDHDFPENQFPFSTAKLDDPITGTSGSLLSGDATDPLIMQTNTSTEYWQKGASLIHTDPLGQRDVDLPANARAYVIAGTQHNSAGGKPDDLGTRMNMRNPHSPMPIIRALLVALDEWVVDGKPPPASRVPRIAGGTLVTPEALRFPAAPGFSAAKAMRVIGPLADWIHPKPPARTYRPLVCKVDADGNEVAGVVTPDLAVPLATYAGWNLYRAPLPEGELADRDGSYLPFAETRQERERNGDPRLSIAERYKDRADYAEKVAAAANALVRDRLLLPEDAAAYIAAAQAQMKVAA